MNIFETPLSICEDEEMSQITFMAPAREFMEFILKKAEQEGYKVVSDPDHLRFSIGKDIQWDGDELISVADPYSNETFSVALVVKKDKRKLTQI